MEEQRELTSGLSFEINFQAPPPPPSNCAPPSCFWGWKLGGGWSMKKTWPTLEPLRAPTRHNKQKPCLRTPRADLLKITLLQLFRRERLLTLHTNHAVSLNRKVSEHGDERAKSSLITFSSCAYITERLGFLQKTEMICLVVFLILIIFTIIMQTICDICTSVVMWSV